MQSNLPADLCVVSYSDLNYDARSANLIDFYINHSFKVITYSISKFNASSTANNIVFNSNDSNRFLINWLKFLFKGFANKKHINAKLYFAADLYSLIFLRILLIPPSVIIYDSREIFSALATLRKQSLKQKILTLAEDIAVRNVKKIVVSGELDADYLGNYFNDRQKKYFVIKNLPKETNIIESNYLREIFLIPNDKIILIYQGVLLPGRGIKPLLEALEITDKYVLVIVGDGFYKHQIIDIIKNKKLENKVFLHQQVNYNQLLNITASADIGVSLIEPITFSYELALPNKLFEYVYAGLPVLVTDLPAMTQFVVDNKVGEIVPPTLRPQEIIEALNKLTTNIDEYKTSIIRKRGNFTYQSQSQTLLKILE